MIILAYTDGASRGNPGQSGIGVILKDGQNHTLSKTYGYIGKATNNIAEYIALIACLKLVEQMNCKNLIVHSDSELMVRQINGEYKVKDETLRKCYLRVMKILNKSQYNFTIKHISREENKEADKLANLGIDTEKRIKI